MTDEIKPLVAQGALTEREAQIAHGLALVRQGVGYHAAAEKAGVAVGSLFNAQQRSYSAPGERESALEAAEKRIEAQVTLIAEASGSKVLEALAEDKPIGKDAAVLYGISTDKVMRMRGMDRQQDKSGSALGEVMERLSTLGLEATISVKRAAPDSQAIDVTPQHDED